MRLRNLIGCVDAGNTYAPVPSSDIELDSLGSRNNVTTAVLQDLSSAEMTISIPWATQINSQFSQYSITNPEQLVDNIRKIVEAKIATSKEVKALDISRLSHFINNIKWGSSLDTSFSAEVPQDVKENFLRTVAALIYLQFYYYDDAYQGFACPADVLQELSYEGSPLSDNSLTRTQKSLKNVTVMRDWTVYFGARSTQLALSFLYMAFLFPSYITLKIGQGLLMALQVGCIESTEEIDKLHVDFTAFLFNLAGLSFSIYKYTQNVDCSKENFFSTVCMASYFMIFFAIALTGWVISFFPTVDLNFLFVQRPYSAEAELEKLKQIGVIPSVDLNHTVKNCNTLADICIALEENAFLIKKIESTLNNDLYLCLIRYGIILGDVGVCKNEEGKIVNYFSLRLAEIPEQSTAEICVYKDIIRPTYSRDAEREQLHIPNTKSISRQEVAKNTQEYREGLIEALQNSGFSDIKSLANLPGWANVKIPVPSSMSISPT